MRAQRLEISKIGQKLPIATISHLEKIHRDLFDTKMVGEIQLEVFGSNKAAKHIYDKAGFIEISNVSSTNPFMHKMDSYITMRRSMN